MSIPKINGQQARGLLDGTTPGPWAWYHDVGLISLKGADDAAVATDLNLRDSDLAAAAPALAETVSWLHGREPDNEAGTHWGENYVVAPIGAGADAALIASVRHMPLTPDEAVDLARALLAAAEDIR